MAAKAEASGSGGCAGLVFSDIGSLISLTYEDEIRYEGILFLNNVIESVIGLSDVVSASVEVDGRTISEIGPGLLVLVGLHESEVECDADYICRKALNMRLFPNANSGKTWDQSVMQRKFEVLLVSQFTLHGFLKGNKPDFHVAMSPQDAKPFYESLVQKFKKKLQSRCNKRKEAVQFIGFLMVLMRRFDVPL